MTAKAAPEVQPIFSEGGTIWGPVIGCEMLTINYSINGICD
jgi:hypothetical protein